MIALIAHRLFFASSAGAFQLRDARLDILDLDGLGPVRQHQLGGPELRGGRRVRVQHGFQHG
jgi:hypothetical protein